MNDKKDLTVKEAFDLAIQNHQNNNLQEAQNYYQKVLRIDSSHLGAHYNLGNNFAQLGEHQKAKDCYEKAIAINPNYTDAYNNLGNIFKLLTEHQKAKDCYEKAIEIDPNYADAYNNLGNVFNALGENQKAISCYEKTIEIDPSNVNALNSLYALYVSTLDNLEKSIDLSYKVQKIYLRKSTFIDQSVPLFRLKHDAQQANYLYSKNYKINGIDEFIKISSEILDRNENKENEGNYNKKILLTPDEIAALLPFYKSDCTYKSKIISGGFINPNKNWKDVEDKYFNSSNQIIYIDDFLSDDALRELREFCLVSKVWNREYVDKYLGAFSYRGFISPIHLQIAIELKKKLPKLFGPHNLTNLWGFKYDSTLGKGINIHADFAIHNLNFWITPDEYNNNKNSGGLKVYDVLPPEDWTTSDYNGYNAKKKIYQFLENNNAKCVNVPYKFNRAVLFNSAYFHETDEIDFKDEYEGRRINTTYLFGHRNRRV